MKIQITTKSVEETQAFAEKLGKISSKGSVYALSGGLGAGKTVIAKGIAQGLGIVDEITSPTFTLLEIYDGPVPFYHFDLYRIEDDREYDQLNFEEYWEGAGVSVIEWSERAANRLPETAIHISIEYLSENERKITIEHSGN